MTAINSVCEVTYPLNRIHLILAFDEEEITGKFGRRACGTDPSNCYSIEIYRGVMTCLWSKEKIQIDCEGLDNVVQENVFKKVEDCTYRGVKVTSCRFEHGGKRHAQMSAYNYLNSQLCDGPVKNSLLLFIDSDIQLDPNAISYFVNDMNLQKNRGGAPRDALTGLITCKTARTGNFWKVLQDTEYIESQLLNRNTENYLGSVTCLPGALTMVRFESLEAVAPLYFDKLETNDSLDFQRCHLGEDRYLTVSPKTLLTRFLSHFSAAPSYGAHSTHASNRFYCFCDMQDRRMQILPTTNEATTPLVPGNAGQ